MATYSVTGDSTDNITITGTVAEDTIGVENAGGVFTIYGGRGEGDAADTDDVITIGDSVDAYGTFDVFGNGGDDSITATFADSAVTATVIGGAGDDSITMTGGDSTSTIVVAGSSGLDTISVDSADGDVTIYGGSGAADAADSADFITFGGAGTFDVFGNGGDDTVSGALTGGGDANVYGGGGSDDITVGGGDSTSVVTVTAGSEADTIDVTGDGGSYTVYGGSGEADSADLADVITAHDSGDFTIYGNGGDDTIDLSDIDVTDSGTVVTAYGGAGDDAFSVGADTAATFVLSGGGGDDTYLVTQGAGADSAGASTGEGIVTITDFEVGSGDQLNINTGDSTDLVVGVTVSSSATLQDALDAAAAAAVDTGDIGVVIYGGSAYAVVEGGGDLTALDSTDQVIKLTGVTDLNVIDQITAVA